MITHIFWDYNGTVLDDVNVSVSAVNSMLTARNLPLTDKETYTDTLCLPLEKYYESVGICKTPISELSVEFRALCKKHADKSEIFEDFFELIHYAKELGIKNILISSLYKEHLSEEVQIHNIASLFDDIIGMPDRNLGTKTQNAKKYMQDHSVSPENVLFIGDLTSDADMAKSLNARCILVPNGHNSKSRCIKQGVEVYDSLSEIKTIL